MIFHRKQRALPYRNQNIMIERKVIEKVNKTVFLEVTLECNISWDDYVVSLTQKASKCVAFIRKR